MSSQKENVIMVKILEDSSNIIMVKILEDSSASVFPATEGLSEETPKAQTTDQMEDVDKEPSKELSEVQPSKEQKNGAKEMLRVSIADQGNEGRACRICLHGDKETEPLIEPCQCTGTMQFVHEPCLLQWLNSTYKGRCEVCYYQFKTKRNRKRLKSWRALPMTASQRTRYSLTIVLHFFVLLFFLWTGCFLITEFMNSDKGSTGYWIKLAIIPLATIAFLYFVARQSTVYVRLYERISVYNMPITKIFGKADNVSRFSRRIDLTMTDGMMSWTSAEENV